MNSSYKPNGYNSLSPYFIIKEAEQWITLLKKIFNAEELRRYERPDGSLMHVEFKIDDTIIMMGSSTKEYAPNRLMVHLYVPNVDETFEKALEYGCESLQKPTKKEGDGDKRGGFKDFAGNDWWISTML